MNIIIPIEIILHIYKCVKSDISLEQYKYSIIDHKRLNGCLTDYDGSFYIEKKDKIIIIENLDASQLDTIKNARLVCKDWFISIDELINLTNCSFARNYYSSILRVKLYHYGLSEEDYHSCIKLYNQQRINNIRKDNPINIWLALYLFHHNSPPDLGFPHIHPITDVIKRQITDILKSKYSSSSKIKKHPKFPRSSSIIKVYNQSSKIYYNQTRLSNLLKIQHIKTPKSKRYGKNYYR